MGIWLTQIYILSFFQLCAGGEPGKDTCSGDGGSPLVCQAVSGRWHVVGLVSWGIGCGVAGRPAIYTNVFHYLDFIYEAKQNGNGDWIGDWSKSNGKCQKIRKCARQLFDKLK